MRNKNREKMSVNGEIYINILLSNKESSLNHYEVIKYVRSELSSLSKSLWPLLSTRFDHPDRFWTPHTCKLKRMIPYFLIVFMHSQKYFI